MTDQAEFARIVQNHSGRNWNSQASDIIWWPLGKERQIVRRSETQLRPANRRERLACPLTTLARSVKANASVELVAHWYEVQQDEVRDAVEFEAVAREGGVRFFFDNNLPPRLARSLHVLVAPEHEVIHLKEKFAANTTDEVWMRPRQRARLGNHLWRHPD